MFVYAKTNTGNNVYGKTTYTKREVSSMIKQYFDLIFKIVAALLIVSTVMAIGVYAIGIALVVFAVYKLFKYFQNKKGGK